MTSDAPIADEVVQLLERSAAEEKRLLKRERRAEGELEAALDDLGRDQARLERAQVRVDRRREEVAEAEARLRRRQEARALGSNSRDTDAPAANGVGSVEAVTETTVAVAAPTDRPSAASKGAGRANKVDQAPAPADAGEGATNAVVAKPRKRRSAEPVS